MYDSNGVLASNEYDVRHIILTAFQTSKDDATENMLSPMYKPMLTSDGKPFIPNISDYAPHSA